MQQQQEQFHARIARIKDPRNTAWKDPETGLVVPKHIRAGKAAKPAPKRGIIGTPVSLVLALFCGALAVLVSRYVRFQLLGGEPGEMSPDIALGLDVMMGLAAAFIFRELFRLQGKLQTMAQLAGIILMIGAMHNLVWIFPDAFASIFSPDWVVTVRDGTQPNSLVFRGQVFTM